MPVPAVLHVFFHPLGCKSQAQNLTVLPQNPLGSCDILPLPRCRMDPVG